MPFVAVPGTESIVDPSEGQKREDGGDNFMKELAKHAPNAAETGDWRRGSGGIGNGGHKEILAQKHECS